MYGELPFKLVVADVELIEVLQLGHIWKRAIEPIGVGCSHTSAVPSESSLHESRPLTMEEGEIHEFVEKAIEFQVLAEPILVEVCTWSANADVQRSEPDSPIPATAWNPSGCSAHTTPANLQTSSPAAVQFFLMFWGSTVIDFAKALSVAWSLAKSFHVALRSEAGAA